MGIREWKIKEGRGGPRTHAYGEDGGWEKGGTWQKKVAWNIATSGGSLKLLHHFRTSTYFTHGCARSYCATTTPGSSVIARVHDFFHHGVLLSLHVCVKPERNVFDTKEIRTFVILLSSPLPGLPYFVLSMFLNVEKCSLLRILRSFLTEATSLDIAKSRTGFIF